MSRCAEAGGSCLALGLLRRCPCPFGWLFLVWLQGFFFGLTLLVSVATSTALRHCVLGFCLFWTSRALLSVNFKELLC